MTGSTQQIALVTGATRGIGAAIAQALAIAQVDDTILITGMGHEQFRIINGQRQPWNDAAVVRSLVAERK